MKKSLIPLLAAAAAIFGAPVAAAATISYSGQIELGQSGFDDVGTVDYFYFVTATQYREGA